MNKFILIPIISALIGWFTNWIAVKMLFHPRKPISILGIKIQGIFPKRKDVFAKNMGVLVSEKLLNISDLKDIFLSKVDFEELRPYISDKLEIMIKERLKNSMPLAYLLVTDSKIKNIKNSITNELLEELPNMIAVFTKNIENKINIDEIVNQKIINFDEIEFEKIVKNVLSKEFKFIEILGGVIGFIIGILQIFIMYYL